MHVNGTSKAEPPEGAPAGARGERDGEARAGPGPDLTPEQFRARMREAQGRGQPFFPWPDLTSNAWRASLRAIQDAVAEVLRRGGRGEAPSQPTQLRTPAGARALGVAAYTSGTGPLLGY